MKGELYKKIIEKACKYCYSNVEVLEYTIMTFDIYDIYAVFTEIDEDLSTYSMTVSVAWYVSSVSS